MKTSSPTEPGSYGAALRTPAATIALWLALAAAVTLLFLAWRDPLLSVKVTARLPAFIPEPFQSFTILDETRSVITMIDRLWETHYRLIASLISFFGVALPIAKNVGVAVLLAAPPAGRARQVAGALQFLGRFAMVDIFAIAIIVSVMAAGTIGQGDNGGSPATVETVTSLRSGFYLFIAYVFVSFAMDVALALRYRREP
jgi:uncharacterized paraquat-inducible protein A